MPTLDTKALMQFICDIFTAIGTSKPDARIMADMLVTCDLMGIPSHGIMRVPQYVNESKTGLVKPDRELVVLRQTGTVTILDGRWSLGQVSATRATQMAIDNAKQHGLTSIILRGCRHVGRAGAFTQMAAEQDCVAMAACSCGNEGHWVAPFGGRNGRLGTNPISFAAPTEGRPIVMDFSTSIAPEGKVRFFRDSGQPLPESWLVSDRGQHSRDPNDLYGPSGEAAGAILPFGDRQGYKSFGLGLMVQILAAALGEPIWQSTGIERNTNGFWLLVMDIGAFGPADAFRADIQSMIEYVRSSALDAQSESILMPGQREFELMEQRQREGIPIDGKIWELICQTAEQVGISRIQKNI